MSTQNKNNFQWRPNDNSVTTNLRYDLEMNHWLKSLKGSTVSSAFKFHPSIMIIGIIFSLALNIILFVLLTLSDLIVWIVDKIKKTERKEPKPKSVKTFSKEELNKRWKNRRIIDYDSL